MKIKTGLLHYSRSVEKLENYSLHWWLKTGIKQQWYKYSNNQNNLSNIALSIGKDISDNNYESISTHNKNAENGYYIVKWTIYSYTFHNSHNIGRYFIEAGELVYDAVYLNSFANFRQWDTPNEKNDGKQFSVWIPLL